MWGKRPTAMLAIYTSRGVAPEVNLRERISCMPLQSLNKAEPTLALKPRGDVTRSPNQGYQWPQKWTCVQQTFLKKNLPNGILVKKQSRNCHLLDYTLSAECQFSDKRNLKYFKFTNYRNILLCNYSIF